MQGAGGTADAAGVGNHRDEVFAARFAGEADGMSYSRLQNPTVAMLEERIALLEGAEACRAQASGMAAMTAVLVSITGTVGFVGLVVSHAARFLVGPSHARLLPASALGGAAVILWLIGKAR